MSTIYFVHAAPSVGIPAVKASRATIDEALREAEFELSGGAAFVWIVDGEGNPILPADQVKARLNQPARATHDSRLLRKFESHSRDARLAHTERVGDDG